MEKERILVDTSVLIEYFRKKDKQKTVLYELSDKYKLYMSIITEFEFLIGLKNNERFSLKLLKHIITIPLTSIIVRKSIDIYWDLKNNNEVLEIMDIFIAATAIILEIPIVTLNLKHFERIKGLEFYN